jgi:hypothetical protein
MPKPEYLFQALLSWANAQIFEYTSISKIDRILAKINTYTNDFGGLIYWMSKVQPLVVNDKPTALGEYVLENTDANLASLNEAFSLDYHSLLDLFLVKRPDLTKLFLKGFHRNLIPQVNLWSRSQDTKLKMPLNI